MLRANRFKSGTLLAVYGVSLLLTTGCLDRAAAVTSPVGHQQVELNSKRFSSGDLMRGLVFSDGPVADMIPEIVSRGVMSARILDPVKLQATRNVVDSLIMQATDRYPEAMKLFEELVTSGDPIQVEKGRALGGRIVLTALYNLQGIAEARNFIKAHPEMKGALRDSLSSLRKKAVGSDSSSVSAQERAILDVVSRYFAAQDSTSTDSSRVGGDPEAMRQCLVIAIEIIFEITSLVYIFESVIEVIAFDYFVFGEAFFAIDVAIFWVEDVAIQSDVAITENKWLFTHTHFFNSPQLRGGLSGDSTCTDSSCEEAQYSRPGHNLRWDMTVASVAALLKR